MEEGVVKVSFGADRVHGTAVEGADFVNEVITEAGALLVLVCVVEVDLWPLAPLTTCIFLSHDRVPAPAHLDMPTPPQPPPHPDPLHRSPLRSAHLYVAPAA